MTLRRRTHGNHRKRGSHSARHHLLELNVRTASLKRQHGEKARGWIWKIFTGMLLAAFLVTAVRIAAEKFFFRNSEYALHHLDAHMDGVMTQEELVALTGFEEGKNLFQLDLDQANRKISAVPEVRSVTLERLLPDTIKVKTERRVPIFLFAGSGDLEDSFVSGKSFLCDQEGVLIQPSRLDPEFLNLPVLRGVAPGTTLAGDRLENDRLAYAIKLQKALLEIPELDFKIRSIDVSKEYAAVVTDASHAEFTFGNDDLPGQVDRFRKLLAYYQNIGRTIKTANLMVTRNTPVTFVLTPETASAKIAPLSATKKSTHH